ncbi:hypothetical protein D3C73_185350 [compost metagenome]
MRVDPSIALCDPKPMTISVVVGNSFAENYDEARFEWEPKTIIAEGDEGFSNVCELCGNPHLKVNFIIHNPMTGIDLSVGSTCIVRFGIIKGNIDIESGNAIVNNFIKDQESVFLIRSLIKGMMVLRPDAKDFQLFYESLKRTLENRSITNPTIDQLGEVCYGDHWKSKKEDLFIRERLNMMWYRPLRIDTIKTNKVIKDPKFKEGSTWHKKRTSVYMPGAARSDSFKPDRFDK